MQIDKKWIEKISCEDGVEWFEKRYPKGTVDAIQSIKDAIEDNELYGANLGICEIFTERQCRAYAIYAARQVLHIFEKEYPNDKRPRLAIVAAEKYLKHPTEKNKEKMAAAWDAAEDAARDAAWAAARAAAWAAARAAAWDAARDAARAAAGAAMRLKILKYGLKILKNNWYK
jgi:hypothetical protein